MKRTLALFCAFAMILTFCGCRETKVETSMYSYFDGEEVVGDGTTASADGNTNTDDSKGNGSTGNNSNGNNAGDNTAADNQNNNNVDNNTGNNVGNNTAGNNTGDNTGNNNTGNNNGGNSNTGSNSVVNNPLDVDLKGATITIYDVGDVFTPDAKKSKTDAAKAEIIAKLQKELNCKFEVKKTDADKLQSLAAASAAGGKALSQIIAVDVSRMGYYISSNLVADMGKISSIDLSKDYMNVTDMPNATQFGKGKYAVAADASTAPGVVYNKRILKEMGYKENYIYDLVDSGKWTYTEFRKLAKAALKDLDGKPGMSTEDQWGIAIMDRTTAGTADLLVSANTPMIKLQNGKLVSNMTNANIAKVATLMRDTYRNDGVVINDNGSKIEGTKAHDAFKNGKVFMEYTTSEVMYWYSNMDDEFGFVPTPKIDGAKKYASALDWNYKGLMVLAGLSAKDQYNAGAVVQAYMYLMQDIPEIRKNEYVNRYFCDDKSGENLLIAMKGVTVHPAQCYAKISETILSGTYRVFWNYVSDGASVSAAVESTSSSLKKALDELNVRIKDK